MKLKERRMRCTAVDISHRPWSLVDRGNAVLHEDQLYLTGSASSDARTKSRLSLMNNMRSCIHLQFVLVASPTRDWNKDNKVSSSILLKFPWSEEHFKRKGFDSVSGSFEASIKQTWQVKLLKVLSHYSSKPERIAGLSGWSHLQYKSLDELRFERWVLIPTVWPRHAHWFCLQSAWKRGKCNCDYSFWCSTIKTSRANLVLS